MVRAPRQHFCESPWPIQQYDQLIQGITSQEHILALFIADNLNARQELPLDLQIHQGDGHRASPTPMRTQVTAEDLLRANRAEKGFRRNGHVSAGVDLSSERRRSGAAIDLA